MEITPIQITVVDFPTYIKICQDILGYSPTRGLDTEGLDVKKPSAFLYTLDWTNHPRYAITRAELYGHCFASFLGVMEFDELLVLPPYLREITISNMTGNNRKQLVLLSGTLAAWDYAITVFTARSSTKTLREFLNIIKRHLERAGYNELWSGYDEFPQADGTFVLKCR